MNYIKKFPSEGGICLQCDGRVYCVMSEILRRHSMNQKIYGADYRDVRPDLWDQDAIEEPQTGANYDVKWCPMFSQK